MRRSPFDPYYGFLAVAAVRAPHFKLTRDLFMFMLGAALMVYEATARAVSDPQIVYGSLALMGVASYLRAIAAAEKAGNP